MNPTREEFLESMFFEIITEKNHRKFIDLAKMYGYEDLVPIIDKSFLIDYQIEMEEKTSTPWRQRIIRMRGLNGKKES
jgi:hypothetical protein